MYVSICIKMYMQSVVIYLYTLRETENGKVYHEILSNAGTHLLMQLTLVTRSCSIKCSIFIVDIYCIYLQSGLEANLEKSYIINICTQTHTLSSFLILFLSLSLSLSFSISLSFSPFFFISLSLYLSFSETKSLFMSLSL